MEFRWNWCTNIGESVSFILVFYFVYFGISEIFFFFSKFFLKFFSFRLVGVIAGSLAVSFTDPKVYLAGASGGVYALISAHAANLIVNWSEMEFNWIRLIFLTILVGTDFGVALYNRYSGADNENNVSYVAHIGGFLAGKRVLRVGASIQWT